MIPTELTRIIYFSQKKEQFFSDFTDLLPLLEMIEAIDNKNIDELIKPHLAESKHELYKFAYNDKQVNFWLHLTILFNVVVRRVYFS